MQFADGYHKTVSTLLMLSAVVLARVVCVNENVAGDETGSVCFQYRMEFDVSRFGAVEFAIESGDKQLVAWIMNGEGTLFLRDSTSDVCIAYGIKP